MARYQRLNPLDHIFFVNSQVRRGLGLPEVNVQFVLQLDGPLDLPGFKRALTALHRLYPATASRLVRSPITGHPRWRLDDKPQNLERVVQVHNLEPPTPPELHHQAEALLISPLDAVSRPPLQFHLFRGLPLGDALVMRWPHALMDVRGSATIVEELQRLYEEASDPRALRSAGDELRDDVGPLIAKLSALQRTRLLLGGAQGPRPKNWQDVRLGQGPVVLDPRGLHYTVRHLNRAQTQQLRDNALRVCGFARLGDFVRACAVCALHRVVPQPPPANAGYSTMQLVDNRKRRQRAPVCHNFFSALPIYVPARIAADLPATADLISESTARMLSSGLIARRYAILEWLSCLPPDLLARIIERSLRAGRRAGLAEGLARAPALPLGFVGIQPLASFCGPKLLSVYGVGAILPHEGQALNINASGEQISITGTYFEPRVTAATMNTFLDQFVATLLNPD